jgi:hypothetical protein
MIRLMMLAFTVCMVLPLASQESGLTGEVTDNHGMPLSGVLLSGEVRHCCPMVTDNSETDSSGRFRLAHRVAVIHLGKKGFAPTAYVVRSSEVRVTMHRATFSSVPRCNKVKHGYKRIGSGAIQFDIPEDKNIEGTECDDYVQYTIKLNERVSPLEFWFGPIAMSIVPDDEQFIKSSDFKQREAICADDVCAGLDSTGRLANGSRWRRLSFAVWGGVYYRDVLPKEADAYDKIINSVCAEYED